MIRTRPRSRRYGFTLIELLVVMSIISLLVSLLLPALSGARRTGQRVACLASLRNIGSGMAAYAADNDDAILGGPGTSGCALLKANGSWQPTATGHLVQRWDFMGALAQQWGLSIPLAKGTIQGVIDRFNATRGDPAFLCKSNNFLATHFQGPDARTGRMVSFNTVRWQLFIVSPTPATAGFPNDAQGTATYNNQYDDSKLPENWRPSVTRMGVGSNKVFCADGARYSKCDTPPDYDLELHAAWGGSFSDAGAYLKLSRSYDRSMAPGSGGSVGGTRPLDARNYAYRHSTGAPPEGAAGNAYKMNLVFYDGHAETQGDLTSTNPHQWLPKDSHVSTWTNVWQDTQTQFGLSGDVTIGP